MKKRRAKSQYKAIQRPAAEQRLPDWRGEVRIQTVELFDESGANHVPYDEPLLERARTRWQFGDWNSLGQLDRNTLQHHPNRTKLALLAAAGRAANRQRR